MQKLFGPLLALLFVFAGPAYSLSKNTTARPYIISGFDDVLRQAENTGLIKAALKIFDKDKSFTGMATLYNVISVPNPSPQFALVSAISHLLDERIESFLKDSQFPTQDRYLRNWLTEWSIDKFKLNRIEKIIQSNRERQFIVIFDNSAASLRMVDQIRHRFPEQVVAIYLRMVVEKPVPEGARGFYTAYDIAQSEFLANRITLEDLNAIATNILNEVDIEELIPNYASCPKVQLYDIPDSEAQKLCNAVQSHVAKLCLRGQSR